MFGSSHGLLPNALLGDRNRINTKEAEFNGYCSSGYDSLFLKLSSVYFQVANHREKVLTCGRPVWKEFKVLRRATTHIQQEGGHQ